MTLKNIDIKEKESKKDKKSARKSSPEYETSVHKKN